MSRTISLEVQPVVGSDLNEMVWQACELVAKLGLHNIHFKANDDNYACYSTKAIRYSTDLKGPLSEWTKTGWWERGRRLNWIVRPAIPEIKDERK